MTPSAVRVDPLLPLALPAPPPLRLLLSSITSCGIYVLTGFSDSFLLLSLFFCFHTMDLPVMLMRMEVALLAYSKSPPWFWAAANNPTRDYCTAGWRDSRAPVGASACCHPREATQRTTIHSRSEWPPRQLSRAAWKAPTWDTKWLSCPSPILTSPGALLYTQAK